MSKRSRSFVFTNNNPTGGRELYEELPFRYIIVGNEHAPTTGTPHHQGYITFLYPQRVNTVKAMLPHGCFVECARGSAVQNRKYNTKEDMLMEEGVIPRKGRRTDIEEVREAVYSGANMNEICDIATSYQSIRTAEVLLKYKERTRDWETQVVWYWGPTGTGKTRTAKEEAGDYWISGKNLKWWDGYDAHENVIIDDFRGDFCTFHELLRILDRYPYRIECKHGSRQLLARKIWITSAYHPSKVYQTVEDKAQLYRRISEIRHFPATGTDLPARRSGVILEPGPEADEDGIMEYLTDIFAEKVFGTD